MASKPRLLRPWAAALFLALWMPGARSASGGAIFTVTPDGRNATLAKDPRGGFAVTWISNTLEQIFARRYGQGDEALTGELAVGSYDYYSSTQSVAALGPDRFRVVWDSFGKYYGGGTFARSLEGSTPPFGGPLLSFPSRAEPAAAAFGRT